MNNFTITQSGKIVTKILSTLIFSFAVFFVNGQAVYTTAVADWTQSWNSSSGAYQAGGGPHQSVVAAVAFNLAEG